ncbi:RING finger and SPRY domain-containing protein 1, partial [Tyrophagus putrescentiae]
MSGPAAQPDVTWPLSTPSSSGLARCARKTLTSPPWAGHCFPCNSGAPPAAQGENGSDNAQPKSQDFAAKSSGWRTSHMLISELFADDNEEDEGDDGEEDYGENKEEELKKKEYETIRYKFSISPPSFYFEATIITVGTMIIGLAVKQMDIGHYKVGSNAFSIGIDGYHRCVWMHKKKYNFKTARSEWNAGDVIGIYVDFVNRAVIFGINSKIIELDGDPFEEEFIFSILPCHVAASLDHYQQCFFNFDCGTIPRAFLNKLESINQNIQNVHNSVLMCDDKQLNLIMKSDEASRRSLSIWSTVTGEINLAYGRVLNESYKGDERITLNACEQWRNQMESILRDIRNPVHFYDEYMRKIGEIYQKLKNDAQKPNPEPSPHNQPLMTMPAPLQLGQSNFSLWLNSLMMALSSQGAGQAVAFPLHEEHPHNLIARGRILLTVPVELQAPIGQLKVAYKMLQVLRHKYEKNDEHSQSSTAN